MNTPSDVVNAAIGVGCRKIDISNNHLGRLALLSLLAGAYISLGGILSVIIGYGFPELTASNPAVQKLLSGVMFPVGLILVVVLGAELFTGNNALLIPALIQRKTDVVSVVRNWILVWVGNFVGALLFTYFMVYYSGLTSVEPYHTAITKIAVAKVSMPWSVVFVKAIGANWCVCLAVWLSMSGKTMIAKMAGCWLPVMVFVALGYEHCIANMFFIPAGMFEGADVTVAQFLADNLVPATLGNVVGGAILVGCVYAYLNKK